MKKFIPFLLLTLPAFAGYKNVRPIVIPHAHVPADLSGFPMAVAGTYPYLATVANGGSVQSPNGYDIVFTSDSGCSSLLEFERVQWSAANGNVEFHVNVPTLSHTSDTTIYLCYGDAAITSDQQNASATWDAHYMGIWHLAGGSTLSMADSTSHGNNGATSQVTAGAGKIDGGAVFNGSGGINMGQTASLQSVTTAFTVSAWVNPSTLSQNAVSTILAQDYSSPRGYPWWSYYLSATDPSCSSGTFAGAWTTGSSLHVVCGAAFHPNQWYYVTLVFDGTNGTILVNGAQSGQSAGPGSLAYGNGGFDIGSDDVNASSFQGLIDEVRVSNIARSANWLAAEYANQSDPNAFYAIGQPISNSSNFSNVSVLGATNTQAIIRFTYAGGVGSCTVAVSRNPSLYPLVNDVNPAMFANANLVSRDSANLISGYTAQIVIGKRYKAFYAADGSRYSRALKQNAPYYYSLNCAGDSFSGSFSTKPLAMGDTHLDGIPSDPNNPGAPAWPSPTGLVRCNTTDTGCATARRDTDYIDPQTGILVKHLVMPDDNVLTDTNSRAGLVTAIGTGWTIPNGWAGSNNSSATISSSTTPLVIGVWNNSAFQWGDVISGPNYTVPVMMQFFITASLGNSACTGNNNSPDCQMDVCVTLNWQTCAPNAQIYQQPLSTVPTQYQFGSGEVYDTMQKPGKRIWAQFETGWRGGGVTCDGSNTVTKIWDSGTAPTDSVVPGSYIWIYPIGNHLVTGSIDSLHFTLDTPCPNSSASAGGAQGPVPGQWYIGGSSFGILVWKETNSTDTLTLSNEFLNDFAGGDTDPQFNSGFYGAPMTVTLGNGDPGGVLQLRQGAYSIDLLHGNVGAFMPPAPAPNASGPVQGSGFDNAGNLWIVGSDKSLTKYVYQGDWATPVDKVGHPELPLWQGWMEATLPTCTSPSQNQCFQPPTTITLPGQPLDVLLTAFDSRYNTNPFGLWYFAAVEMGKLYFDIRWNNSPGQNYWGWVMIFDPQATSNVYGPYGAGCVGQNTNPAGANYLMPGCIVAARRVSDYPHWMTQKGPAAILRAGWSAQQESIYAFGGPGGGPAVANKLAGTFSTPSCPSNSYGYTACVQFTVDGDPYDFSAGSSSRGVLGTYAIGDLARLGADDITYPGGPILDQPNINLLQLLQINGTTLTFACVYGASYCPADVSGQPQMLWMYSSWPGMNYPWSPMVDLLMWNWANDPHGQNLGGNTIVWDYSTYNAHGFSANSLFSQGGTWSTRCAANQGCYNNQNFQSLVDSAFAAAVMTQTRENVTGLVAMSSYFAGHQGFNGSCGNDNCQTHPDYSKLGSDPVSNYGIDIRPFVGIQGLPWASDISIVAGTLYKVANISGTLHPKIFDTEATSARHILRNISGPGSVIGSDSSAYYTICEALHANECQPASSPGDVFVNVPYLLTSIPGSWSGSACYFPPGGFATNTSDNWSINDLCIFDSGMEAQSGTRYSLASFDYVGRSEQTFGHLFNNGRSSIFSAIHPATNITASTYPQWYYFPAQFWDGVFSTMLLESPPVSIDSGVRTTFQPLIVNMTPIPGSNGVGVEFGYAECPDGAGGFECNPNRSNDPCVALGSTINESTPFYWESEGQTPPSSGPIAIPALPEHVVYYRPVY